MSSTHTQIGRWKNDEGPEKGRRERRRRESTLSFVGLPHLQLPGTSCSIVAECWLYVQEVGSLFPLSFLLVVERTDGGNVCGSEREGQAHAAVCK